MNFNELSWAAVCFYYRSVGDSRYTKIMRDTEFISKLREAPSTISPTEFEQKIILDYVYIENYDLLIGHNLARNVLAKIVELQPEKHTCRTLPCWTVTFTMATRWIK